MASVRDEDTIGSRVHARHQHSTCRVLRLPEPQLWPSTGSVGEGRQDPVPIKWCRTGKWGRREETRGADRGGKKPEKRCGGRGGLPQESSGIWLFGGGEEGRQWDLGEGPHWAGGRRRGPGRAGRGLGRCLVMAGTSLVSVDFMHRHWEATEPEGQRKGDLA